MTGYGRGLVARVCSSPGRARRARLRSRPRSISFPGATVDVVPVAPRTPGLGLGRPLQCGPYPRSPRCSERVAAGGVVLAFPAQASHNAFSDSVADSFSTGEPGEVPEGRGRIGCAEHRCAAQEQVSAGGPQVGDVALVDAPVELHPDAWEEDAAQAADPVDRVGHQLRATPRT